MELIHHILLQASGLFIYILSYTATQNADVSQFILNYMNEFILKVENETKICPLVFL